MRSENKVLREKRFAKPRKAQLRDKGEKAHFGNKEEQVLKAHKGAV